MMDDSKLKTRCVVKIKRTSTGYVEAMLQIWSINYVDKRWSPDTSSDFIL